MPQPATDAERIVALESGLNDARRDLAKIRADVSVLRSEIRDDIAKMRDDLAKMRDDLAKRPSWAVCTLISILLAASTGLGSALVVVLSTGA